MNDSNDFSAPDPVTGFGISAQPDSSSDPRQAVPPPEVGAESARPVAFCQTCGRGLTSETARPVGQAVFCEPCLEARLAGGPVQPPPPAGPYGQVPYGPAVNPGARSLPNPGLATILGFIPGVGAMYNEQYAKGIVHLIVFVLLIIITGSYGIFGIFIAGWEFYMAIDANHTARARRDGLPLPNPFGLNDIGERLGFGKAWPAASGSASGATSAAQQAARGATAEASRAVRDAVDYASQTFGRNPQQPAQPYGAPVPPNGAAAQPTAGAVPPYGQAWTTTYTGGPAAYPPPYSAPYPPPYPVEPPLGTPAPLRRFPVGAAWLIGLGCIFLLANTGLFDAFHTHAVIGLAFIGLGAWVFTRRMNDSGLSWQNDGSRMYRYRVFRALRVSVWLVAIGIWLLLDAFRWVHLHYTWPIILIIAGVMALLERVFANAATLAAYQATPEAYVPGQPETPAAAESVRPAGSAAPAETSIESVRPTPGGN